MRAILSRTPAGPRERFPGRYRAVVAIGALFLLLAACGDDPNEPDDAAPVANIIAPGDNSGWAVGQPIEFSGTAEDADDEVLTLSWQSDRDGEIGTGASMTTSELSAGRHVITFSAEDARGSKGNDTVIIDVMELGCASLPVAVGDSVDGSLGAGDCVFQNGTFADPLRLYLPATQPLRLALRSEQFDTYLLIMDVAGEPIAGNDDGGIGTNSKLILTLQPGTYYLVANSYGPGETGDYSLTVEAGSPDDCAPVPLDPATTAQGALTHDDCAIDDGSYVDLWSFTLGAPTRVRLTMRSTMFDTYLGLFSDGFTRIAVDDDGAGGTDSRIEMQLPAGTYLVAANSYDPEATGDYTVQLEHVAGAQAIGVMPDLPGAHLGAAPRVARLPELRRLSSAARPSTPRTAWNGVELPKRPK